MFFRIISILLLLLLPLETTQEVNSHNCELIPGPGLIVTVYQNSTKQYSTLQEAINSIETRVNNNVKSIAIICLPPGLHKLTRQIDFGEVSLALVGSLETTVECAYEPVTDYTWYLNQSEVFHLHQTTFVNCPRPFRIIAVENVNIQDCAFE